jgi:ssDNA-binding Zn-finger/Zn-ribbon topoisomerase 1
MPCPACKKGNLRIMYNRGSRRYFVACSAYPDCRQTYSLPPNSLIKKSENKFCEADSFQKLLAIRKGKRPWEFCFNPECPVEKKKREEWQAKKNAAKAESEQEQEQSGNQENTQTEE